MTENAPWLHPLVSGFMLFDRPAQYRAAWASIDSFFEQSWPCKELVIFNTTSVRLIPFYGRRRAVKEIRLNPCPYDLMLTVCSANANGEWCAYWRPDCVYHPSYLVTHMAHRDKQRLVLFKHRQVYSISDHETAVVSDMLVPTWTFYRHFAVDFFKVLAPQFPDVLEVDNAANLIVQFVREIA